MYRSYYADDDESAHENDTHSEEENSPGISGETLARFLGSGCGNNERMEDSPSPSRYYPNSKFSGSSMLSPNSALSPSSVPTSRLRALSLGQRTQPFHSQPSLHPPPLEMQRPSSFDVRSTAQKGHGHQLPTPPNGTFSTPSSPSRHPSHLSPQPVSNSSLPKTHPPLPPNLKIPWRDSQDKKPAPKLNLPHSPSQSTPEDNRFIERDQYGFKKTSQWLTLKDFAEFESKYGPVLERRRHKWETLIQEHGGNLPSRSTKVKRYIRKGIPSSLRGKAWLYYSGADRKMHRHPGLYTKLICDAQLQGSRNEYAEIIERDLHRTFPENIRFQTLEQDGVVVSGNVPAIQSLRRVLLAFSVYVPSIGYCQSLNYIAGLFLIFMGEEEAFWMLVTTIVDYLPPRMYDVTMDGVNTDQDVLMLLIQEKLPTLWSKLGQGMTFWELKRTNSMPTVTLVTCHWFLTMYINIFPIETVLRVWDCFFYEGQKILFRVALTVLKMNEAEILAVDDPLEVFQVVQNLPKRMIDCHRLMEMCFSRMFHLTEKDIDRRREIVRQRKGIEKQK
ncbi:uncharacterized protein VTP21DRAFT_7889 [Calcarisporiella thermophila]|uniref:uncharacterized protein n=1 Tax=Calcarisporiella thermophila TaxID=911321 RepID=UPI0037421937